VNDVNQSSHTVEIKVDAINEEGELVLSGSLLVCPPYRLEGMDGSALDNF
jgi:3-hydroxybutyryl-CoA dehydratase